jgi:hypothetical protein
MAMTRVLQVASALIAVGVVITLGGIALIYPPLAVILAGSALIGTGAAILRGSRP